MNNQTTTIVLADDHEFLREGLKSMFKKMPNIKMVGEATNGIDLVAAVAKYKPTIVITDVKMPEMDGIEATTIIKQKFPKTKVIALSNYDEEHLIADMLNAGADGYLLKNCSKREMEEAIEYVKQGKAYYCSATSKKILSHFSDEKPVLTRREEKIQFTTREKEVLKLISRGLTNKEIGKQLQISARTVESHRTSITEKTGLKSAASLALFAAKFGYL